MKDALYYGDNLEVLRKHIDPGTVDLVYLDPPFNSNRNYNVIFARQDHRAADAAQIQAFEDTWHWTPETDDQYVAAVGGALPGPVGDALHSMHSLLGENDAMAYLVNMAPRLVELHRVLKSTGSIYLHCDPTMSHYLKVLMDSVFAVRNFRNEIIWKRTGTVKGNFGQGAKFFGPQTDTLLFYAKADDHVFNQPFTAYTSGYTDRSYRNVESGTGRRYQLVSMTGPGGAAKGNPYYEVMGVNRFWRYSREKMQELIEAGLVVQTRPGGVPRRKYYLDEGKGVAVQSLWEDIPNLQGSSNESLGYPTQKPVALLERIISTSSNEGDVVLDPFCGCGTAIDAAARLKRHWVGIDITYLAIDLIVKRLERTFGDDFTKTFDVRGIPRDEEGATALFQRSHKEFERWAVSLVNGTPTGQTGDKGVDGVVRFFTDAKNATGKAIVSVKGGDQIGPQFVRDLLGTIESQKADLGLLVTRLDPTKGMKDAAAHAGTYTWPVNDEKLPKVQIVTVGELLAGKSPRLPPALTPYIQAQAHRAKADQLELDDSAD